MTEADPNTERSNAAASPEDEREGYSHRVTALTS